MDGSFLNLYLAECKQLKSSGKILSVYVVENHGEPMRVFGFAAVCLRHQKLGALRGREAEHLRSPGDTLSDPHLECVRRRGSRDLS